MMLEFRRPGFVRSLSGFPLQTQSICAEKWDRVEIYVRACLETGSPECLRQQGGASNMCIRYSFAAAGILLAATGAPVQAAEMFATNIESFAQATQGDGHPVIAERSNPDLALGAPVSGLQPEIQFVTLGIGGTLILSFEEPFANSLRIYETTW